jgi:hypothetical protein
MSGLRLIRLGATKKKQTERDMLCLERNQAYTTLFSTDLLLAAKWAIESYSLRTTGRPSVAKAMQQRGSPDVCYAGMLESIARVNYTPALGQLAEKALQEDTEPAVAGSAATVLSEFGPQSAEQALRDRFTIWSERWRDREAELRSKPGTNDPYQRDRILEFNLANGIGRAKAWKISPADFGRLANLCVTVSCRNMVENWQRSPDQ